MFERLIALAERRARARVEARREELAGRLHDGLPDGIEAEAEPAGVRLSGRGLTRRLAFDARLGWLIAGLRR